MRGNALIHNCRIFAVDVMRVLDRNLTHRDNDGVSRDPAPLQAADEKWVKNVKHAGFAYRNLRCRHLSRFRKAC
jgi:hypothetical protein